jgi:vacuolar-type H+-ATPase subunit E/Vma4
VDLPKPPPLDEWDKLVASTAERYKFTDAQATKARSILRDLRRRAYQYQVSRSVEFAKAESIVNKKARGERLQTLKAPLHAMFAELGQRLESLATVEQRQQAPTPKKGRK